MWRRPAHPAGVRVLLGWIGRCALGGFRAGVALNEQQAITECRDRQHRRRDSAGGAAIFRTRLLSVALLPVAVWVAGCGASPSDSATHLERAAVSGPPSPHVHGVALNPADARVYLATHEGLFRFGGTGPERVGPVIDLMGFTVAGPDHFLALGHPGTGTDMPDPVGLIESRDASVSWTPLSREGQSDFHTLTATASGVLGFDGTLRSSADGVTWDELEIPVKPVVATDAAVLRSTDGGSTFQPAS